MLKDMFQIYLGGIFTGETMKVTDKIPTFGSGASSIVGAGFLSNTASKVSNWFK